jgi:Cytochrome C oxidase, cbb3-type, subunit III
VSIATWLLHESVPAAMRAQVNPLGGDPADIAAGGTCSDRNAKPAMPMTAAEKRRLGRVSIRGRRRFRSMNITSMPDGEVFYHIRNGIRNTGMPAWSMPDAQIWQLVAYLRNLPKVASLSPEPAVASAETKAAETAHYVGSAACRSCHTAIFDRWSKTLMANVARDPKQHPDAIIPDLTKPDPLVTFNKDDIAFVYGSEWKQRYFTKVGDDYFPLSAQWDVTHNCGGSISSRTAPTGGCRSTRPTMHSGQPARSATAAIP